MTKRVSVTATEPCAHCKKPKRCLRAEDGTTDICYGEANGSLLENTDQQGVRFWVFAGPNYVEPTKYKPLPIPTLEIADVETRHKVYSELLKLLATTSEHREHLKARGLDLSQVASRRYGSVEERKAVWRAITLLRRQFSDPVLLSVPGFVVKTSRKTGREFMDLNAAPGLLIPVRDEQGHIASMKVRPDKATGKNKYVWLSSAKYGGPRADNRPHTPLAQRSNKPITGPCDKVRVTEGPLKSDVATSLNCQPTLGTSGAGNWRKIIPILQGLQAQSVLLAYDADASTNPEVAHHTIAFHAGLIAAGFSVIIETWPEELGKGIDDLLAAGGTPERLEGDAAAEYLEKLKTVAATRKAGDEPEAKAEKPITVQESDDDPHRLGRLFIENRHTTAGGVRSLIYWQSEFLSWDRGAWRPCSLAELKSNLAAFIKAEFDRLNILAQQSDDEEKSDEPPKAKKVTRAVLENTIMAIQSMVILQDRFKQPCWLADEPVGYPARELLATQSGLLHLPSIGTGREYLLPLTPNFFTPTALDYGFDPTARCSGWLKFLDTLWPSDAESIRMLQEFFGLLLTSDTSFHKLLMIIGPARSGKGTIGRTAKHMLGEINVASPTLGSLAEQFGLASLIGKSMALVADARLSGRADAVAVVERLLSITGEDNQDVQRKHMQTLAAVRLAARFVILANELPRLQDAAGALLSRVLLLRTSESFVGREDRGLENRLQAELPGILNWAIEGWQRLMARGRFEQPTSGRELIDDLEELASPITQFIRERCILGPQYETEIPFLYVAWKDWCEKNGREHPGTQQTFGRDIRASKPQLLMKRLKQAGKRTRAYVGIRLRTDWDAEVEDEDLGPRGSAAFSIACEAKKEKEDIETIGDKGTRERNGEGRGPSRTLYFDSPAEHAPPATPVEGDTHIVPDADRPRNVRADAPSLPPWVNREGGDAA